MLDRDKLDALGRARGAGACCDAELRLELNEDRSTVHPVAVLFNSILGIWLREIPGDAVSETRLRARIPWPGSIKGVRWIFECLLNPKSKLLGNGHLYPTLRFSPCFPLLCRCLASSAAAAAAHLPQLYSQTPNPQFILGNPSPPRLRIPLVSWRRETEDRSFARSWRPNIH